MSGIFGPNQDLSLDTHVIKDNYLFSVKYQRLKNCVSGRGLKRNTILPPSNEADVCAEHIV